MKDREETSLLVSFDPSLKAHIFHLRGTVTVGEATTLLGEVYRDHDSSQPLNLIFVDEGLTSFPTQREFVEMLHFAMKNRPPCQGRTAMVGTSDASFGIFRMVEGLGGEFFRHQRVFRTLDEARRWIVREGESSGVA